MGVKWLVAICVVMMVVPGVSMAQELAGVVVVVDDERLLEDFAGGVPTPWLVEAAPRYEVRLVPALGEGTSCTYSGDAVVEIIPVAAEVSIYDLQTGDVLATMRFEAEPLACPATTLESGIRYAVPSADALRVWLIETMVGTTAISPNVLAIPLAEPGTPIAVSGDGSRLLAVSADESQALLWDGDTGAHLATFVHDRDITAAALNEDGTRLATLTVDWLHLWDVPNRRQLNSFIVGGGVQIAFAQQDRTVVVVSVANVRLWEIETGDLVWQARHDGCRHRPALALDDAWVSACGRIFEMFGGAEVWTAPVSGARIGDITSDGTHMAVYDGRQITVWAVGDTSPLVTIPNQLGLFDLSINQRYVVVGRAQSTILIFDASSGATVLELVGHQGAVNNVIFTPDRLVTAGDALRVWVLP